MNQVEIFARFAQALGSSAVERVEYVQDMGEFPRRAVCGVLRPRRTEDVVAIVAIARESGARLYPVSTGKNWGLGSKQPVSSGCFLVDTSGLDRIRQLDLDRGIAVVEPGVTQADLVEATAETPWVVNLTGSCAATSVLGNALDRGVGNLRQRTDDLLGLEVVTGSGEVIRCGSFWSKRDAAFYYRHGVGPDLVPLFCQSNLGVVTAGIIELVPRPEQTLALSARFSRRELEPAMSALRAIYGEGLLPSVTKIYNATAFRNYGLGGDAAEDAFLLFATLMGSRTSVEGRRRAITELMRASEGFGPPVWHDVSRPHDETAVLPRAMHEFLGNRATCLTHASFGESCDIDRNSATGWLLFLPVVPHEPAAMRAAVELIAAVEAEHGVLVNATMNVIDRHAIDLVTTIRFERADLAARERAHFAFDVLVERFDAAGFHPYRHDIDHMDPERLYGSSAYVATLRSVKRALDPAGVIAPGRYLP